MIAKLTGLLDSKGLHDAIIDCGGVGYLVHCSGRSLSAMPAEGETVSLHIVTDVREDAITLFGFRDKAEREWFGKLCSVQGVGPRVGLAILSALKPDELYHAFLSQDKTMLTRADGVGPKLAQRMLNELADKVTGMAPPAGPGGDALAAGAAAMAGGAEGASGGEGSTAFADAVSALVNLGYGRAEAFQAVGAAAKQAGDGIDVELLIKGGLKELMR